MNKRLTQKICIIGALLATLFTSGCTLLDDSNAYVFEDYETELSSMTTFTKQLFAKNTLNETEGFDVDPFTPGNEPIYLDVIDASYDIIDIHDLSTVSGLISQTVTSVSSDGTVATLNYQETASATPNAGNFLIEKFVQKVVTSISATENEVETTITGNMTLTASDSISFAFENFSFTTTIENDVNGSDETLADIDISASFPFTLTYNSTVLSGTLSESATSSSNAISLGGDIRNDGLTIGSLFISWDSYDDFLLAVPRVIVRDQTQEVVPEL